MYEVSKGDKTSVNPYVKPYPIVLENHPANRDEFLVRGVKYMMVGSLTHVWIGRV